MAKISKCRGCQAEIIWIETKSGRKMPLDAKAKTVFIKKWSMMDGVYYWAADLGHESHFATCPQADQFRRSKNDD